MPQSQAMSQKTKTPWTWDSPTHATSKINGNEVDIALSRPIVKEDLVWLYNFVFKYEQLDLETVLKG